MINTSSMKRKVVEKGEASQKHREHFQYLATFETTGGNHYQDNT